MMASATFGSLLCIMCSASAQDAQYAAGAIRLADLTPKPPRRMGNVANSRACCWSDGPPGNPPNSAIQISLHALVMAFRVFL